MVYSSEKGKLISVEGIEGSGKSTFATMLKKKFDQTKIEVILTREPGGTELGLKLRSFLLNISSLKFSPEAELFLFAADRAEHISSLIIPNLDAGNWVLSDRFVHSTLAYQGYGRGFPITHITSVSNIATKGILPDLVFLLDLDPYEGLKRASLRKKTGGEWTRFEEEKISFHKRIREGFLEIAELEKNRFVILDAKSKPEELVEIAWDKLKEKFPNRLSKD